MQVESLKEPDLVAASPPLRRGQHPPPGSASAGGAAWCMSHQLEMSLAVLVFILAGNALVRPQYILSTAKTPDPSEHLQSVFSRFIYLSFKKPGTNTYYKGRDDAYLIAFYVVLFWFVREGAMRWFWTPFARLAGCRDKRSIVRFTEQAHALLYYAISWSVGMYLMQTSPYRNLDTKHFYIGYPHDALAPLAKWYYLVQTAFWLQQIVILNLEARRKDHRQMLTHHLITTLLVSFSYVLNWTRVGNAILVTMDFSDILFPLAKLFLYTQHSTAADVTFGLFLISWIATRHVLFGILLYSVAIELPRVVAFGWNVRAGYFNSAYSHSTFTGLLLALQVMMYLWLNMILKVAYNALTNKGATDTRSESGESDAELDIVDVEDDAAQLLGDGAESKKDR